MLMSAGLPLPRQVFGHGFVYQQEAAEDQQVGRARRSTRWTSSDVHGAEAFRYYFMSECPFGGDGKFSDRAVRRGLQRRPRRTTWATSTAGPSRCASSTSTAGSTASAAVDPTAWRAGLDLAALVGDLRELVGSFEYNVALQRIWLEVLDAANRYIEATEPFKLAKTDLEACKAVLVNLAEALRVDRDPDQAVPAPRRPRRSTGRSTSSDGRPWDRRRLRRRPRRRPAAADLRVTAPLVGGKPAPLFPKIEIEKTE